jgi:hypothetical protein
MSVRWRKVHGADRSSSCARTEADTDSAGRQNLVTLIKDTWCSAGLPSVFRLWTYRAPHVVRSSLEGAHVDQ